MILLGYGFIALVLLLVAFGGSIPKLPGFLDAGLRVFSILVAAGAAGGAAAAIAGGNQAESGQLILWLLLVGSVTFLYGQLFDRWLPAGHIFRIVGWLLSVAALLIPTTLTLLLPLAAILVFILPPRRRVHSRDPLAR
jgi:hypothetical protein